MGESKFFLNCDFQTLDMVTMMCEKENGGKEEICPIILQPPMLKKETE